jgi:thiol-disulfide isomerase/thioredoxin
MNQWIRRGALVALGVTVGLSGCVKRDPSIPAVVNAFRQGEQVDLVLPKWPEGSHDLAQDRGNVVLLDVWATWCEPCRDALPVYEQLQRQYGDKGLRVYAINMDEDPRQIEPFVRDTKVQLPILREQDGRVENSLGVRLMPTSFILDRQGRLRHRHEGFNEAMVQKYQQEIEALLSER